MIRKKSRIVSMNAHNLDISMYSLKDLLQLFRIDTYKPSHTQMVAAKKQVLMTHPDKSGLESDYFIFYKKAYAILLEHYNDQVKQSAAVEDKEYSPLNDDDHENKKIKTKLGEVDAKQFSRAFNEIFDNTMSRKVDETRNEWFHNNDPVVSVPDNVNAGNMAHALDSVRSQQVVVRRDVRDMMHTGGTGLYEEEDDDYIGSDPFGKLRFDDLRRVHKDETVFSVRESDINNVTQYNNVEDMARARGAQNLTPIDKARATKMMDDREKVRWENVVQKQHVAKLESMEYEKKNGQVMASMFLRLKN